MKHETRKGTKNVSMSLAAVAITMLLGAALVAPSMNSYAFSVGGNFSTTDDRKGPKGGDNDGNGNHGGQCQCIDTHAIQLLEDQIKQVEHQQAAFDKTTNQEIKVIENEINAAEKKHETALVKLLQAEVNKLESQKITLDKAFDNEIKQLQKQIDILEHECQLQKYDKKCKKN